MQKLVATRLTVNGPQQFEGTLPEPKAQYSYYRDLKVLAIPAPAKGRDAAIPKETIIDLSAKINAEGKLVWDAPTGAWQVLRIGCTTTGRKNLPSPQSGVGLECDKFNPEAMRRHFDGFLGKLVDDVAPDAGRRLPRLRACGWRCRNSSL